MLMTKLFTTSSSILKQLINMHEFIWTNQSDVLYGLSDAQYGCMSFFFISVDIYFVLKYDQRNKMIITSDYYMNILSNLKMDNS